MNQVKIADFIINLTLAEQEMKKDIHPSYYKSNVVCGGCGANFTIGSTSENIQVNVCSECHPFYTGTQKLLDTEGRIDKFKAKYAKFAKN